jgi:hypothetical protein
MVSERLMIGIGAAVLALWVLFRAARAADEIRRFGPGPWLRSRFSFDPENGRLIGILLLILSAFLAMRRWGGVDGYWFSLW